MHRIYQKHTQRTFLEISSFVLAGKQTDTNFAYYNLCDVNFVKNKIYCNAEALPPKISGFSHIS